MAVLVERNLHMESQAGNFLTKLKLFQLCRSQFVQKDRLGDLLGVFPISGFMLLRIQCLPPMPESHYSNVPFLLMRDTPLRDFYTFLASKRWQIRQGEWE